jgi:hypothetical protein
MLSASPVNNGDAVRATGGFAGALAAPPGLGGIGGSTYAAVAVGPSGPTGARSRTTVVTQEELTQALNQVAAGAGVVDKVAEQRRAKAPTNVWQEMPRKGVRRVRDVSTESNSSGQPMAQRFRTDSDSGGELAQLYVPPPSGDVLLIQRGYDVDGGERTVVVANNFAVSSETVELAETRLELARRRLFSVEQILGKRITLCKLNNFVK